MNIATVISGALRPRLPLPGTVVFQGVEVAKRAACRKAQSCSIHCSAKRRKIVENEKGSVGLGIRGWDCMARPGAISVTLGGQPPLWFSVFS